MKSLNERIEWLLIVNQSLKDRIDVIKAGGECSVLCNLREEFDETFDSFFDDIRGKYEEEGEWLENNELLEKLNDEDKESYIEFIENYNDELEAELNELR